MMASKNDTSRAGQNARNHPEDAVVSSSVLSSNRENQPRTSLEDQSRTSLENQIDPFADPIGSRLARSSLAARAMMASITGYQRFLSPLKAQPTCRFYPSCSQYALEAVREHGAVVGAWLAVKRVSKCHPLHPGGLDPVPARNRAKDRRLLEDR